MSGSKKNRRRSSLAPFRIVPVLSPAIGLCNQIEGSLQSEERLEQLSLLCLKSVLEKVGKKIDSTEVDVDSVKEAVLREVQESAVHKEAVMAACQPPSRLLPNPDNIEMDEIIKQTELRIHRIEQEEKDWETFLDGLEQQAKDIESQTESGAVLRPSELTEEQRTLAKQYLPELPDLNHVRQQGDEACKKISTLAWEHERTVHMLQMQQIKVSKQLDAALKLLNEKTFPQQCSPKASVQHLIEFPTPPAEPQ